MGSFSNSGSAYTCLFFQKLLAMIKVLFRLGVCLILVEAADKRLSCPCTRILDPVCGENGRSYGNPCQAQCDATKVKCFGSCPCDKTTCPTVCKRFNDDSPVCGVDGQTYPNGCLARCKDIRVNCKGSCPCKD